MTRAAVVLALAFVLGIAWALCREQQRVAASWQGARHPDDLSPYGPTRG